MAPLTQSEISNLISELLSQNAILTRIENTICEKYSKEEILQSKKPKKNSNKTLCLLDTRKRSDNFSLFRKL